MIRVGAVPANKVLFAETVPANNLFDFLNNIWMAFQQTGPSAHQTGL